MFERSDWDEQADMKDKGEGRYGPFRRLEPGAVPWWYGPFATVCLLGAFWLIVAVTPWLVMSWSLWALALLAPLLGISAYKLTILMHDCSHMTLFRRQTANALVGQVCAGILGADFKQFTRIHWLHHRYLSEATDPQRPDYVNLREASPWQIVWHLMRPLVGYNLFFKVIQYATGEMIRSDKGRPESADRVMRPMLLPIVLAQGLIVAVITGFGEMWGLAVFYPVCAGTIGLFLSQTRGFAEHVAPAGAASDRFIRSHRPNWLDNAVFFTLNFNYHLEHHLYPSMPSWQLPRFHQMVVEDSYDQETLSPSVWQTISKRIRQAS